MANPSPWSGAASVEPSGVASQAATGSPSQSAVGVKRKLGKWCLVTALFALLPMLFDLIVLRADGEPVSLGTLFSQSSTYLIAFGISASGLGDALYERRVWGFIDGWTIFFVIISTVVMILSALFYATEKSQPLSGGEITFSLFFVGLAAIASFFTVLVSAL